MQFQQYSLAILKCFIVISSSINILFLNSAILSSKHFFVCWFMQKDPYPKRNCIYCPWRSKMRCPWRWKFFWDCNQHRHNFIRLGITMGTYIYLHNWEPRKFTPSGVCFERHLIMYLPRLMHGNGPKQQQRRRQQICLWEKTSTYIIAEKRTNPPWRRWLKLCSISIVLERINEIRVSDCMYQ